MVCSHLLETEWSDLIHFYWEFSPPICTILSSELSLNGDANYRIGNREVQEPCLSRSRGSSFLLFDFHYSQDILNLWESNKPNTVNCEVVIWPGLTQMSHKTELSTLKLLGVGTRRLMLDRFFFIFLFR